MSTADQPEHVRHRPPTALDQPRPVIIACPQFKSQINLSRLVRLVSCCAIYQIVTEGSGKIDPKVARDGAGIVSIERRRSLAPRLAELKREGYRLVGLEQTTRSQSLYEYRFPQKMVFVLGHERLGITEEIMSLLDDVVEIPVYGLPYSYNVVTAATMAMYEYCRQYPKG
jgi:tRNA G18 (ribose-2'-O)-methylase SpoU